MIRRMPFYPPPRSCQWPHGDPKHADFRFCHGPIETVGSSYCDEHRARAYQKAEDNPDRWGKPAPGAAGFAFGRKGAA
jgi:GcrA cell cycle regulator